MRGNHTLPTHGFVLNINIISDYFRIHFISRQNKKEEAEMLPLKYAIGLFKNLHRSSATAGDYIAWLDMQQLVADGTVDVTFFFCPNHAAEAAFEFVFHSIILIFFCKNRWGHAPPVR